MSSATLGLNSEEGEVTSMFNNKEITAWDIFTWTTMKIALIILVLY